MAITQADESESGGLAESESGGLGESPGLGRAALPVLPFGDQSVTQGRSLGVWLTNASLRGPVGGWREAGSLVAGSLLEDSC